MYFFVGVENFAKIEMAKVCTNSYTLLVGPNNSGKTFLMKLIQEYCVKHKILKNPQNFQRIKFSSGEDALHYEELLFGSEDPEGGLKA